MSILLVVDASSCFMRALNVLPEEKRTADDLEYMVVSMIRKAVRRVRATHLIVAMDTLEPCWRLRYHPTYKGDRDYKSFQPRQLTPILRPRLESRGIAVAYAPGQEADDVLATLAHVAKPTAEVYAYTRDSDLHAILASGTGNVRLLWPDTGGDLRVVERAPLEAELGHPVQWLPELRALTADRKDNLRGMMGPEPPQRVPITRPRAVDMMKAHDGDMVELLTGAIRYGAGEGDLPPAMRDKEAGWIAEHAEVVCGMWNVATLNTRVVLEVNPAECAAGLADLSAPLRRPEQP